MDIRDLILIVAAVFAVYALAILVVTVWGWIHKPKCPKCGMKKTFGPTDQQRKTTSSWNIVTVHGKFQCSHCGYTKWKKIWRWNRTTRTGGPY